MFSKTEQFGPLRRSVLMVGFQALCVTRGCHFWRERPLASGDTAHSCMLVEAPRAAWDLGLPLPPQPA